MNVRGVLRSRSGISILEVLVAGAIGTIFMMSMLRQVEVVQLASSDVRTKLELSTLQTLLMQNLSAGSCSGTFLGVPDSDLSNASFAANLATAGAAETIASAWRTERKAAQVPTVQEINFNGATFVKLQNHASIVATLDRILARGVPVTHVGAKLQGQSVVEQILLERQTGANGARVPAVLRSDGSSSVPLWLTLISGPVRRQIPFIMDITAAGTVGGCTVSVMGEDPLERQCTQLRGEWVDHPLLPGDEKLCRNFYKQEARFIVNSTYNVGIGTPPSLPSPVGWVWEASIKRGFQSANVTTPGTMSDWYLNLFREANVPPGVLIYDKISETVYCNSSMGWNGKLVIPSFTSSTGTSTVAWGGFSSGSTNASIPFAYAQRIQLVTQTQSRSYHPSWETVTYSNGTSAQRCTCATWAQDASGNPIFYLGVRTCQTCETITQAFPQYLNVGIAGSDSSVPPVNFGNAPSGTHPNPMPLGGPPPLPANSLIVCVKDI